MKITCISDLHGFYPELTGGDLLIVAGDLTSHDEPEQHEEFCEWLDTRAYRKKIVIAGNHDNNIDADAINSLRNCEYLQDSGTEFEGLKLWGSPWTPRFFGMNPSCMAFTYYDESWFHDEKLDKIPHDIDILITHGPPYGILDKTLIGHNVGSKPLRNMILDKKRMPNLKAHFYGHIHEFGLKSMMLTDTLFVNCSVLDEQYKKRDNFFQCQYQNSSFTVY